MTEKDIKDMRWWINVDQSVEVSTMKPVSEKYIRQYEDSMIYSNDRERY